MTVWKNEGWDKVLSERFGEDVYDFLKKDKLIIEYLSDNYFFFNNKNLIRQYQLSDNSIFVIPICKVFEGVLYLIAREAGWFKKFNKGIEPNSIRWFYNNFRSQIEEDVDSRASGVSTRSIKDKLFSTVEDFKERNVAMHYGSMLKEGEVDNYHENT